MESTKEIDWAHEIPFLVLRNLKIIDVNDEACYLFKLTRDELLGKDIAELGNMLRCSINLKNDFFDCSRSFFIFDKLYEPIEVKIEIEKINQNELIYFFKEVPNSKLENNMPLFRHLFNNNKFGVAAFSVPEIKLLKANKQYLNFLDKPFNKEDTSIGRRLSELISGWTGSSSERIWKKVLQTGQNFHIDKYEFPFERGITYWDASLIPIFENDVMKYVVEVTRDITEDVIKSKLIEDQKNILKQQRDELERVLKMKEEFFSYISHEFKTPLTVMISTVQLINLIYKNQVPEKVMKYINKLNLSALQQLRLVNNLLDITRGESGYLKINKKNLDIVSMTRVIADSVTNFAVRKNVKIQFESEIQSLMLAIDDEKYERILLNLLSNAIKFTQSEKSIYVSLSSSSDKVFISVRDEGVGIPEHKIGVIFERFGQVNSTLTRQGEGTGIGLCLVKVLVEALDGDIKVESRLGEGSTFTIALPISTIQEDTDDFTGELLDNRLVQSMDIEFSNIYFE